MNALKKYYQSYTYTKKYKPIGNHFTFFVITGLIIIISFIIICRVISDIFLIAVIYGGGLWLYVTAYIERGILLMEKDTLIKQLTENRGTPDDPPKTNQ